MYAGSGFITGSIHRLFQRVFQDKEDLLELYNAINGTDHQNPEELEITTLEDVIFMSMKNDKSFMISSTMNLYEHQSTVNPNMPVAGCFILRSCMMNTSNCMI